MQQCAQQSVQRSSDLLHVWTTRVCVCVGVCADIRGGATIGATVCHSLLIVCMFGKLDTVCGRLRGRPPGPREI